jgi:branched-chain amino acid aminotransferase
MTRTMVKNDIHSAVDSATRTASYAFLEGRLVPLEEAKISIMTHGFLYGTAIFEGIRGYYNEKQKELYIFRLAEHFERLTTNCKIIKVELPHSVNQLVDLAVQMVRKSEFREDIYLRPIGYKSSLRIGLKLDDQNDFLMFAVPMGSYLSREHALSLMVSSWRRVEDNAIPARAKVNGSYVNLSLAAAEARDHGFDEAILLNEDGSVSEAAGMNIFIVRSGKLITPPVTDNVLEGITRNTIFEMARDLGIEVEVRTIDRSELYAAEEGFLSGTGAEIASIGSVDGRKVGEGVTGPLTAKIQATYFAAVHGETERYKKWLTPVWNRRA